MSKGHKATGDGEGREPAAGSSSALVALTALGATSFFKIPPGQVIELGTQVEL